MTDRPNLDPATYVAYASEGMTDPDDPTRHMVAYVEPGKPGYWPTTYTGTLDYCRAVADSINASLGRTREDVRAAVASSMAASR